MIKDKRVLIISSEVVPYLPQTTQAVNAFQIAKAVNDAGGQTRIFMPRYGLINERRHQLHEVIRLSGMNLVINDMDMPLIIKVASIPKERMQVYFIDNEEYFKRKGVLHQDENTLFPDNDERMIFFTKGVVETVKKLNWSPDIIHLHGWFTSLFPIYLKSYFENEPLFENSSIMLSAYAKDFEGSLAADMHQKMVFDGIDQKIAAPYAGPNFDTLIQESLPHLNAFGYSSDIQSDALQTTIKDHQLPTLEHTESTSAEAYVDFYAQHLI
ncbi:MAG: glycogen/starch synthase [Flavobacteriaceae bacterium]